MPFTDKGNPLSPLAAQEATLPALTSDPTLASNQAREPVIQGLDDGRTTI